MTNFEQEMMMQIHAACRTITKIEDTVSTTVQDLNALKQNLSALEEKLVEKEGELRKREEEIICKEKGYEEMFRDKLSEAIDKSLKPEVHRIKRVVEEEMINAMFCKWTSDSTSAKYGSGGLTVEEKEDEDEERTMESRIYSSEIYHEGTTRNKSYQQRTV